MKLVTDFRDYYDAALRMYALDPEPFYKRESECITLDVSRHLAIAGVRPNVNKNMPTRSGRYCSVRCKDDIDTYRNGDLYSLWIIGFCGKLYPIYCSTHILGTDRAGSSWVKIPHTSLTLSEAKAVHAIKEWRSGPPNGFWGEYLDGWDAVIESKYLKSLFFKYKTPVFALRIGGNNVSNDIGTYRFNSGTSNFIINPPLINVQFARYVDAYTAVQELLMFMQNDLVQDKQPKMPVGSDKVIAESKVFDKWSFKTMPTKK